MIDENKVGLMTKLAIYEKHESSHNLVMSKYYKSDYVRYNVLKTLVASTVVYWAVVGAYIFMKFDELLAKINDIDYFELMYDLLGGYVIFCLVYFLIATALYNYRYSKAKPGLIKYNVNLKKLIELEGGNSGKQGKVVAREESILADSNDVNPYAESERTTEQRSNRPVVNRSAVVRQRMQQEEMAREQQIKENVRKRNERIAAQKEEKERQQRQLELERRRIQERRRQMEQEQLNKLRNERTQQTEQVRENHVYRNNSETGDMGRRDR